MTKEIVNKPVVRWQERTHTHSEPKIYSNFPRSCTRPTTCIHSGLPSLLIACAVCNRCSICVKSVYGAHQKSSTTKHSLLTSGSESSTSVLSFSIASQIPKKKLMSKGDLLPACPVRHSITLLTHAGANSLSEINSCLDIEFNGLLLCTMQN